MTLYVLRQDRRGIFNGLSEFTLCNWNIVVYVWISFLVVVSYMRN